jgi:hypothetical protein
MLKKCFIFLLFIYTVIASTVKPHTQLTGFFDHEQHPTPSPTTRQGLVIKQCVCMYDQFMVPLQNSFSVVTLTDHTQNLRI